MIVAGMYFSRIRIDLRSLSVNDRRFVARGDTYAGHQLLWRAFPGLDGSERDFLFRQEVGPSVLLSADDSHRALTFYVVSPRPPASERPGYLIESRPYAPLLRAGERLVFSLRANPTVSRRPGAPAHPEQLERSGRSQRHSVVVDAKRYAKESSIAGADSSDAMRSAAIAWLRGRAADRGFDITERDAASCMTSFMDHRFHSTRSERAIRFTSVDYAGEFSVADPDRFVRRALFAGIGRARAFGCGLLLVRRAV